MATIDPKTKDVILTDLERLQLLGAYLEDPTTLVDSDTEETIGQVPDFETALAVAKNHRIQALWKAHVHYAEIQIRHQGSYDATYLPRRPVRIIDADGTIQQIHPRTFRFLRDMGVVLCEGIILGVLRK